MNGWLGGETLGLLEPIAGPGLWAGLTVFSVLTITLATGWFLTRFIPRFMPFTGEQKFRSAVLELVGPSLPSLSENDKRSVFFRRLRKLDIALPSPSQLQADEDWDPFRNVMVSIAMTNRRGLKEARRVSKILRQAAQSAEAESLRGGGYHEACE